MTDNIRQFTALSDDAVALDDGVPRELDGAHLGKRDLASSADAADAARLNWCAEIWRMLALALPSMLIQANIFYLWLYNAHFAGTHLGTTAMAAVSLANLSGNLTALSVQYGLIYALETLTSHAMGSGRVGDIGVLVQRCLICCALALIPGFLLWFTMEDVLLALGQPPAVSALAGRFLQLYALGLPGMVAFEVSRRFLGCQDVVLAYVPITALVTWVGHPLLLSALLSAGLGFDAVPIATGCSMWALALLAFCYISIFKPHDPRSWHGLDVRAALSRTGMAQFLKIAVPGIASMSEWWYWEVICAAVGVLGEFPLAAHSIAYAIVPMLVMAPIGVSIAISIRVGQLIGEGRPRHAKLLAVAAFCFSMLVVCGYTAAVGLSPEQIIGFFASEEDSPVVFQLTRELWPLVSTFLLFDGFYMTLNGVVRALSLQLRASAAVMVSLWMIGMPAVLYVTFRTDLGLRGIWLTMAPVYGILDGLTLVVVGCADWSIISAVVRERAGEAGAAEAREAADALGAVVPSEAGPVMEMSSEMEPAASF